MGSRVFEVPTFTGEGRGVSQQSTSPMKHMNVSVIVPAFNKGAYIERCIRSILAQTFSDFELIIVDDGSTDDSMAVVQRFSDTRIKVIEQENRGPGAARNVGIAASSGDICAFLDADDEWLPHYLEESVAALEDAPFIAAVVSGYIEHPSGISKEGYWRKRGISDSIVQITPHVLPTHLVSLLAYMSCWSTVARRKTLLRWGGFYERDRCRYAEDSFLWLKVLLNEKVRFCTKPRVRFHREASALSNCRTGPRPIEPFLIHPQLVRTACPPPLSPLLESFLAIRAFKTCCMLSLWGEWREARQLFLRFARPEHWRLPLFFPALTLTNPAGAQVGRGIWKMWAKRAQRRTPTKQSGEAVLPSPCSPRLPW